MAKQSINRGSSANDGTGDNLRTGAGKVNDNFNEIYTAFGDGTTITSGTFITDIGTHTLTNKTINGPDNTLTNIPNSALDSIANAKLTNSSISIIADDSSAQSISLGGSILFTGGSGITTSISGNEISFVTDGSIVTETSTDTLTNKSIDLTDNTLTGTTAEFNTALTDGSFATLDGAEVLQNKVINSSNNTISNIVNADLSGSAAISNANLANPKFSIRDDSSTTDDINLGETLLVTGGTGITSTISANELTLNVSGITNAMLSGSAAISNGNLANTEVTIGATSVALGATIGSASNFNLSGSSSLSGTGTIDTTGAGNKLRFNHAYADAAALGSAIDPTTYEGMFAYNTTDNKAYVADTGGWVRLFDENISVGDISNVDLTGIANGNVLTWNSGSAKFVAGASGGFSAGSDLDQAGADVQDVGYVSHRSPDATVTQTLTVTVATKTTEHTAYGDGSSSGYLIDGHEGAHLSMTPGVYKFDQADSSNSGHPLLFYREAAKTTAYSTNVTTSGTPGSAGAHTTITITKDTPQVLHYQCSAHANMGGVLTNIGSEANLGITHADQWRLTTNFASDQMPLLNLEQNDNPSFTALGTAMSFSSGIFTFPVTGIWHVSLHTEHYMNGTDRELNGRIRVTQNNSTYVQVARGAGFINGVGSNTHTSTECSAIVDVTDTANVKVQFGVATDQSSANTIADTSQNVTFMTFIRLGDT